MIMTYLLYIFRLDKIENKREQQGPNATLNDLKNDLRTNISKEDLHKLQTKMGLKNMTIDNMNDEDFQNILNIKTCSKPSHNNPFMNALVYDSRTKEHSCDPINPNNQDKIEYEYNKYCIKDISDIYNHNSGRRQFYTMPSTTYPNNQEGLANWLYKTPPTCKEGNGTQCVANNYTPLNSSFINYS